MEGKNQKLTLTALILMIFTSVFGFNNATRAFYLMGYYAIPWYVLSAITFFIPYAFMMSEFGAAFRKEKGGIYTWMERSVNTKFAFIGTFMWFASNIIWLVTTSSSIWVPLSNLIFGTDTTEHWKLFGLDAPQTLAILASIFIVIITLISSKGLRSISKVASIGGIFVTATNLLLLFGGIIVLACHNFKPEQPINFHQFVTSPNAAYQSPLAILGFVVFALFAYGGLETIGGLVDETENPKKNFPKGITISALIIAIGYALGILVIGFFINWNDVLSHDNINMVNVSYVVIQNLGIELGKILGLSNSGVTLLGSIFARYIGLSMFLAYVGAFFTLIYAPLKQLIEGTPKEIWPKSWTKLDKNNMPVNAMWIQSFVVIAILLISSFGGKSAGVFFNYLILMGNVAMTIPYMFLSYAFIYFKKKTEIEKPFEIYKNKTLSTIIAIIVTLVIGFANVFTILSPALESKDYLSTIFQLAGPVVFGIIGFIIYKIYENRFLK